MLIVDANVLVYAVNENASQHRASHDWLSSELKSGNEVVGLPWVVLLAFIRLTTNPRLMPHPLSPAHATDVVRSWLRHPRVITPQPSPRHADTLAGLLARSGTAANLTNDAHLAALALELDATVVSFDRDFGRFGVRLKVPSEE